MKPFNDCFGGFKCGVLQKNKALLSLKGSSVGMKLKLHSSAIAIAILSRPGFCSA